MCIALLPRSQTSQQWVPVKWPGVTFCEKSMQSEHGCQVAACQGDGEQGSMAVKWQGNVPGLLSCPCAHCQCSGRIRRHHHLSFAARAAKPPRRTGPLMEIFKFCMYVNLKLRASRQQAMQRMVGALRTSVHGKQMLFQCKCSRQHVQKRARCLSRCCNAPGQRRPLSNRMSEFRRRRRSRVVAHLYVESEIEWDAHGALQEACGVDGHHDRIAAAIGTHTHARACSHWVIVQNAIDGRWCRCQRRVHHVRH